MFRKTLIGAFGISVAVVCTPVASAHHVIPESASLVLTVTGSESPTMTGTLQCRPAGGLHRKPAAACRELSLVNGDFDKLDVGPDRACTLQYDPVYVTATGHWHGKKVDFATSYGNSCQFAVATGPVFAV
ncbi:SSI family serine proteinase inhibitor [Actinokineospora sp.]|uniref:SSI family serine proteinase inhibitor n=1 Tax=Actinokineospora sp. TaxID=1872133 RepID=UPI003D6A4799